MVRKVVYRLLQRACFRKSRFWIKVNGSFLKTQIPEFRARGYLILPKSLPKYLNLGSRRPLTACLCLLLRLRLRLHLSMVICLCLCVCLCLCIWVSFCKLSRDLPQPITGSSHLIFSQNHVHKAFFMRCTKIISCVSVLSVATKIILITNVSAVISFDGTANYLTSRLQPQKNPPFMFEMLIILSWDFYFLAHLNFLDI